MSTHKRFTNRFANKYQLVLRNVESFSEKGSYPFHYTTLLWIVMVWFILNFGISLWLAKSALGKWMNPVYIETENQKKILALAATVEQFKKKLHLQNQYITTLQGLMQGHSLHAIDHIAQQETAQSSKTQPLDQTITAIDNLQKDSPPLTHPLPYTTLQQPTTGLWLVPMVGMITEKFNPNNAHYGIDLVAKDNAPIKAIADGRVIFSDWSVETGWIIAIQHYTNDVSICKHCAILFKKVGDLVKIGDVIALMGNSGEISTGPHLHFELWKNGRAQNPENFINFH